MNDNDAPVVAYQTGDEITPASSSAAPVALGDFVHLAVHSEFSIHDGLIKVRDLAERAAALGMPAVALTDRGNLFGLVKFYAACREHGIKAIIGVDWEYEHAGGAYRCVLLATCAQGYGNLLRLVSSAYTGGADDGHAQGAGHGRTTREAIFRAAEGLVVLLGRDSDVGEAVRKKDSSAPDRLSDWRAAFAAGVYLEVVRTGRPEEDRFAVDAAELAANIGAPVVASNDVRFLQQDDFEAHETRVCIQEGRVLDDSRRQRRYSDQQYLRDAEEMRALFADLPEALDNTLELAKRCSHELPLGTYHLPEYPVPQGATLDSLLAGRAADGLARHLDSTGRAGDDAKRYRERLDYELGVISEMGFAGYFLIVEEFVNWGREHHVPVGCRGSGNASLVAFSLGITDLDPLEYDLLFERLLNPERVSMPDFDIDFCMEGRERVINHVEQRYGHDAVSQIVTFGTMAARSVVRDVARVQGKPFGLADRLSKMIPFEVGMTLAKAMEREQELRDFVERNEDAGEIVDMAYKLEGVVRNTGKHAGGVVIAPTTLTDFVPLYADQAGGGVLSQFDLHDVEEAGLVKFDFLGLKTLTIVDWTVRAVNEERRSNGEPLVDIKTVPLDDPHTYEFLKTAETTAVFQLESDGMKELIRRLLPDRIDDIIALVALYRPGPLQSGAVEDYIERKHGRAGVQYAHPSLESALRGTYGVMLYQEQAMVIAQHLAGFSLGQADLLRRAMAKKKPEEMVRMRTMFLAGTDANGVDRRVAGEVFDQVEKFAGYAFNKAHAASYALLSFQTAWLKAHFPAPFMAAVLSADMDTVDKIVPLVDEARRLDIALLPPDVNASAFRFVAQGGSILYGLGAVRGVGEGPVAAIVAERERGGPFTDLANFCRRVDARRANKRVLEALARSGAMDSFGADGEDIDATRARLLQELPDALQSAEQTARDAQLGISDMFGGVTGEETPPARREARPISIQERLQGEKETLGLYLTGHPVKAHLPEIRRFCPQPIRKLRSGRDKQMVAGLVVSSRTRRGRRGAMSFFVLDDQSGRIEVSAFGEVFTDNRAKIVKDAIVVVEGEVQEDAFSGGLKMRADGVMSFAEARARHSRGVVLRLAGENAAELPRLRQVLARHRQARGCAVFVDYAAPAVRARLELGAAWRVDADDALLGQLRETLGEDAALVDYG